MGQPKALLPTRVPGETFLARVVGTLRRGGVDDVIVVVAGVAAAEVAEAARGLPVPPRLVENPRPEEGQLSSLLCALRLVDRPGVRGMLVTLVDVPLVAAETVATVLRAYRESGAPVVRPAKGARHGHPVVFDRAVFEELRRADAASGAKAVVRARRHEVLDVPVEDEGAFADIDTREDYERVFGRRP